MKDQVEVTRCHMPKHARDVNFLVQLWVADLPKCTLAELLLTHLQDNVAFTRCLLINGQATCPVQMHSEKADAALCTPFGVLCLRYQLLRHSLFTSRFVQGNCSPRRRVRRGARC